MPKKKNPGNGRYESNLTTAERDAAAARMRAQYATYQQITDELGFSSPGHAHTAVKRALKAAVVDAAEELRAVELERLDGLARAAEEVLRRHHVVVSQGRVVRWGEEEGDKAGLPLEDDGPVLQAIDRLVKISAERRKLLGLDAATKVEHSGGVRYEVVGLDD